MNNGLYVVLLYASYYVLLEPFAGITWLLTHGVGCYAAATSLRQVCPALLIPLDTVETPLYPRRRFVVLMRWVGERRR